MNEATLKAALVKALREELPKSFVILRHEERRGGRSGVPDISVTGYGRTVWIEVKFADPEFDSQGLQELTMLRLANAGLARYVIFDTHPREGIRFVKPTDIANFRDTAMLNNVAGFDHELVAEAIRSLM